MSNKVRIILEHKESDRLSGYEGVSHRTIVIESEELANELTAGEFRQSSYSVSNVIGAELVDE